MALKLSTGLRTALAGTFGLKTLINAGFIDIYTGSQPSSPDAAETGTKLCRISSTSGTDSTAGITFGTAGTGILPKSATIWSGTAGVTGVAGWFRLYDVNLTTGADGTARRIDGNVGVSGSDLVLSNTSLTAGATLTIDSFNLEVPQSA